MSVNNNRIYNVMNAGKDFIVNHKKLVGAAAVGLISVIGLVLFFGKRFSWIQKPNEDLKKQQDFADKCFTQTMDIRKILNSKRIDNFVGGLDAELGKLEDPDCEYDLICKVSPNGTPTLWLESHLSDENDNVDADKEKKSDSATEPKKCEICQVKAFYPTHAREIVTFLEENQLKIIIDEHNSGKFAIGFAPNEHTLHRYDNLKTSQKNMLIAAFRTAEYVNNNLNGQFFDENKDLEIKISSEEFPDHSLVYFQINPKTSSDGPCLTQGDRDRLFHGSHPSSEVLNGLT